MWTFRQNDGVLLHDGTVIATGYSGYGAHADHPADESLKNLGPIPEGAYTIGAPEYVDATGPHGPFVLPLTPSAGTTLFGRGNFLIHGDNAEGNHTASQGCIIMPKSVRVLIAQSGDPDLSVVT
jgi:hypothetical protein